MLVPTVRGTPFLLPGHEHPEFGEPGLHYHVDYRFVEGKPDQAKVIWPEGAEVEVMDLPMVRDTYTVEMSAARVRAFVTNQHLGRKAACGTCPHRGLPIFNGVCPGHGMVFDAEGNVLPLSAGFEWSDKIPLVSFPFMYCYEYPEDRIAGDWCIYQGDRRIDVIKHFDHFGQGGDLLKIQLQ